MQKWRKHHRNETKETPQNISDVMRISHIRVANWHSEKDGKGDPEAVMLVVGVHGLGEMGVRLKSRDACDALITALQNHRDDVFGGD